MACLFGLLNVISYFHSTDPLISLSDSNQKRFIQQIHKRLSTKAALPGLIGGSALVALLASLIELPCTAGFPVIWSSLLASRTVSLATHGFLLAVYLLMYILIELCIVLFMVKTMSKRFMKRGSVLVLLGGLPFRLAGPNEPESCQ